MYLWHFLHLITDIAVSLAVNRGRSSKFGLVSDIRLEGLNGEGGSILDRTRELGDD